MVGFIHDQFAGGLSGEVLWSEQVATADLSGVEVEGAGQIVHGPLQQPDGLGPAWTSVGAGGNGVGHHRRSGDRYLVNSIGAGEQPLGLQRLERAPPGVAAHVGAHFGTPSR